MSCMRLAACAFANDAAVVGSKKDSMFFCYRTSGIDDATVVTS